MAQLLRALRVHTARPRGPGRCVFSATTIPRLSARAAQAPAMQYEDAVHTLNLLQTNGSVLEQVCQGRDQPQVQLQAMRDFLWRSGLKVEDLDGLNVIHVAGTKGKGSTCAFAERILWNYGFRTGFYSSPHLVQVRERLRINGQSVTKELFTKYFWSVYSPLDKSKDAHGGSMPSFFSFLTLLAFHVFLQEKVDVAVIEAGIGGAYDCTNIIRKPWVCGISSLGIDHTNILGDTIEKIAWQKAGIFKPGVPAFTVPQPTGPMVVLQDRAQEIGCPLFVCPELEEYETPERSLHLGLAGHHQRSNAALALQLCQSWLQQRSAQGMTCWREGLVWRRSLFKGGACWTCCFSLASSGLEEVEWPGRSHTIRHGPLTYCLDGAHTTGSMLACVRWFLQEGAALERMTGFVESRGRLGVSRFVPPLLFPISACPPSILRDPVVRVLLFNTTGERDSEALLKLLRLCHFDFAVFCPNITETVASSSVDQQNLSVTLENMLNRCLDHQSTWWTLSGHAGRPSDNPVVVERRTDALVFPCILSALQWISQGRDPVLGLADQKATLVQPGMAARMQAMQKVAGIQVLITGSLHLVGRALMHLKPSLAS
ncbi:folylpolyglutamate synthase, mitochondrial-like [Arapaima gigas]